MPVTRHVSVLLSFVGLLATVFVVWIYILVNDVSDDCRHLVELSAVMVDVFPLIGASFCTLYVDCCADGQVGL